jgi:predicted nucleic acid-binding protein
MKGNCFVDSNILIYAHTNLDLKKQGISQTLLKSDNLVISVQVINELISVFRKKFNKDWKSIGKIIAETTAYYTVNSITEATINQAIKLSIKYEYSYYDSLIIASALESNCKTLYSEDFHHSQIIDKTLTIINPLK